MIDIFANVYLPSFFDWLIETSIMASIVVGLILCVKILLRNKLTPRWQYMLWMILIIRLLLPWSPDSSYSIYSILSNSNGTSDTFRQEPVAVSSAKESMQEKADINHTTKEDTYTPSSTQRDEETKKQTYNNQKQNDDTFSLYTTALYIWLAGVIILSFAIIIMNRRLLFYIKKQPVITDEKIVKIFENCKKSMSVQQDIPLLLAGKISSPTVFGFFRPRVLLSSSHMKVLDTQQLQHIFYHELAHIKRRDVGVNWLMHGLLILNWFNPILWYAYSCMREDQELACDALALTFIDSEEQIAYGHTIISLLEHYSSYYQVPSLANLSRNKRTLKRRILMIKKFQKKSYRWSGLGVVAVIAVSSLSLLNAQAEEPKGNPKENITTVNTKDKASESINVQNTTEEKQKIQTLMLNSIDHFNTAKGSFEYFTGDDKLLVEYQTDLSMNPRSYEKVRGIATKNHPSLTEGTLEPGYEIATYDGESLNNYNSGSKDFQTNSITKDSKPQTHSVKTPKITIEERNQLKDSSIDQRISGTGEEKTYISRRDPSYMRIAKTSLFPEDIAMGYMEDQTKWNITGQENIAGIDTLIIEGELNNYYSQKYNAGKFKLNVDPNTGILLQMEVTDSSNNVKQSLKTKTIEIDKTIDTKLFSSIEK